MSTLRISDAPLLPDVDGTEKIPTGGRGDYTISINQIKDHIFQDIGKELVGLGNVDNTSDLDKPVSTAQQAALNLKADKTYVDTNLELKADKTNVYTRSETSLALSKKADLVSGVIPENQIPSSFNDVLEFTTPNLPIVGESGKIYVTTDNNKTWRWSGNKYVEISGWNPDSVSKSVTLPTYYTKEAGVDPVTGVADGEYFNVRSPSDDSFLIEYQNIGGVPTPSGKSYPSSAVVAGIASDVAEIKEAVIDPATGNAIAEKIIDASGKTQQQINDSTVKELATNLTIPVGAGQTHTTIKSAISYLTRFKKVFVSADITAEILIKSGFVAQEQISVEGMDLSWITISSEDVEVTVQRSALTEKIGRWWSFMRFRNSSSPKINTLFNMDETGTELDRVNLYLIHSNSWVDPGKGFKNGYRNVDITQGSNFIGASGVFTGGKNVSIRPATSSQAFLQFADVSNSNTGISCGSGAVVAAEDVIARNCTVTGLEVQGACTVEANGLDVSGAGQFGIYARKACVVNADELICNGGSGYGVYASNGAVVNIDRAQITDTTGVAGVLATYGATVAGDNAVITGNKINIFASKGGSVLLDVSTLTEGVDYGLYCSEGGRIVATNSSYRKTVGVDSPTDARVRSIAEINVFNSTGGGFTTFDVQTAEGVIRKNGRSASQGGATIASGTTSIVVTHGLVGQPAVVVTPRANLSGSDIWVNPVNASTFTINISAAPTTNLNLFWSASLN